MVFFPFFSPFPLLFFLFPPSVLYYRRADRRSFPYGNVTTSIINKPFLFFLFPSFPLRAISLFSMRFTHFFPWEERKFTTRVIVSFLFSPLLFSPLPSSTSHEIERIPNFLWEACRFAHSHFITSPPPPPPPLPPFYLLLTSATASLITRCHFS